MAGGDGGMGVPCCRGHVSVLVADDSGDACCMRTAAGVEAGVVTGGGGGMGVSCCRGRVRVLVADGSGAVGSTSGGGGRYDGFMM